MPTKVTIGILALLSLILGNLAKASEYYPYWNSGSYSHSKSSPMISLNLDEAENLNSSFRISAREGRLIDLKDSVRRGANINSRSEEGETALMYASRNCAISIVHFL